MKVIVRKPLHREEQSNKPVIDTGKTLTEQSHKNAADINFILRDYANTGFIRHANKNPPDRDWETAF